MDYNKFLHDITDGGKVYTKEQINFYIEQLKLRVPPKDWNTVYKTIVKPWKKELKIKR